MSNILRRLYLPGKYFVSKIFFFFKYNSIAFRVNSRIQSWSADYRLAIAQSAGLKNKEAGPSTTNKSVASGFRSNYYGQGPDLVQMIDVG